VCDGCRWGFIDQMGKLVIEPRFEETRRFNESVCPVRVGEKWGLIDKTGSFILDPAYLNMGEYRYGVVGVQIRSWDYAQITVKGEVIVADGTDWPPHTSYVTRQGEVVIPDSGSTFYFSAHDGLVRCWDTKKGEKAGYRDTAASGAYRLSTMDRGLFRGTGERDTYRR